MFNFFLIIVAYFIGSFPSAFIVGKIFGSFDIRDKVMDMGLGTSAIHKNIGVPAALLVFFLDAGKGVLALFLADRLSSGDHITIVLTLVAAIVGHNWSLFLKFAGGKGAATICGSFFYLLPEQLFLSFAIMAAPFFAVRKKKTIFNIYKNSLFTAIVLFFTIIFSLFSGQPTLISFSPFFALIPMWLKRSY